MFHRPVVHNKARHWLEYLSAGLLLVLVALLVTTEFSPLVSANGDNRIKTAVMPEGGVGTFDPVTGLGSAGVQIGVSADYTHRLSKYYPGGHRQILNLEVRMLDRMGFRVLFHAQGWPPKTIDIPMKDDEYDYSQLTNELFKIKQAYESRQTVLLVADDEVGFGKVLLAAVACRELTVPYGTLTHTYPIFPNVIFTNIPP